VRAEGSQAGSLGHRKSPLIPLGQRGEIFHHPHPTPTLPPQGGGGLRKDGGPCPPYIVLQSFGPWFLTPIPITQNLKPKTQNPHLAGGGGAGGPFFFAGLIKEACVWNLVWYHKLVKHRGREAGDPGYCFAGVKRSLKACRPDGPKSGDWG
jgi:hypothetical protein